ncbi:NAD(P)-binding protein [Umbelopsis sp. PMI_123]|nr:NAD(P)-binding protein [Umbelopsis sp. PMI_123]
MRLLIFGATGPTGREIIRKALASNCQVNVMVRNPGKLPDDVKNDITVFKGELTDKETILASMDGVDAIISALGPLVGHPSGLPITKGYQVILDCMRERGIRRLIALSTPSFVDEENDRFSLWIKLMRLAIKSFVNEAYLEIIATSQLIANQDDLDWTIFRVGVLKDSDHESGNLKAGYAGEAGMNLYRKDIAKFCIDEVSENKWVHKMPILWS